MFLRCLNLNRKIKRAKRSAVVKKFIKARRTAGSRNILTSISPSFLITNGANFTVRIHILISEIFLFFIFLFVLLPRPGCFTCLNIMWTSESRQEFGFISILNGVELCTPRNWNLHQTKRTKKKCETFFNITIHARKQGWRGEGWNWFYFLAFVLNDFSSVCSLFITKFFAFSSAIHEIPNPKIPFALSSSLPPH